MAERRKSWREMDAQRDRGGARKPDQKENPFAVNARASKQYRAALDALFEKGEVGKVAERLNAPTERTTVAPAKSAKAAAPTDEDARSVLRKKLVEAIGRDAISRAFDRYTSQHGMPSEFELLEQGLEHNRNERIDEVLQTLDTLLDREKPKRSRTLAGKLRLIEETSSEPELSALAACVRAKL